MTSPKLQAALDACIPTNADTSSAVRSAHDEVLWLFDACGSSLFRYVRSLGIESAAAQDIIQEVFLALFHHLRRDRPRNNLKGWLFKVAHNLALRYRHRIKRRDADL